MFVGGGGALFRGKTRATSHSEDRWFTEHGGTGSFGEDGGEGCFFDVSPWAWLLLGVIPGRQMSDCVVPGCKPLISFFIFQTKKRNRIPFAMQLIYHKNDRLSSQITTKRVDFFEKRFFELGCHCRYSVFRLCGSRKQAKDNMVGGILTAHADPCRRILPGLPSTKQSVLPSFQADSSGGICMKDSSLLTTWLKQRR